MRKMIMELRLGKSALLAAMMVLLVGGGSQQLLANSNPFATLLGSWGGSGLIVLQDGRKERIKCTGYYTGGGTQLGLAIYCKSNTQDVKMRGKISYNAGSLSGTWEERNFNASGNINGTASNNRITMRIGGNVSGTMIVSFTKRRQKVTIKTSGIGLKSVNVTMSRR